MGSPFDYDLLLQKLQLLGLSESSLQWIFSYLSERSQCVIIDGHLSEAIGIDCGVPQGSILGPLLYILFTNDIPDLVHNHPVNTNHWEPYCQSCGATVCYVDDSTFSYGHHDASTVSRTLTN